MSLKKTLAKYPRLGEVQKRSKNTSAKCAICGEHGKAIQWVQETWMRGDDEKYWLCLICLKKPAMEKLIALGYDSVYRKA